MLMVSYMNPVADQLEGWPPKITEVGKAVRSSTPLPPTESVTDFYLPIEPINM